MRCRKGQFSEREIQDITAEIAASSAIEGLTMSEGTKADICNLMLGVRSEDEIYHHILERHGIVL